MSSSTINNVEVMRSSYKFPQEGNLLVTPNNFQSIYGVNPSVILKDYPISSVGVEKAVKYWKNQVLSSYDTYEIRNKYADELGRVYDHMTVTRLLSFNELSEIGILIPDDKRKIENIEKHKRATKVAIILSGVVAAIFLFIVGGSLFTVALGTATISYGTYRLFEHLRKQGRYFEFRYLQGWI